MIATGGFANRHSIRESSSLQENSAEVNEESWTANRGPEAGCLVIMEGDPQPAGLTGRLSFQKFNPAAEDVKVSSKRQRMLAKNAPQEAKDSESALLCR